MIQSITLWWQDRSLRERRMLTVMLALLGAVIFWYGIVRPIERGLATARADHAEALDRNAAIRLRLAALKRPLPAMVAASAPLAERVEASASEAGFVLTRNPSSTPGRIDISIGSARPTALFGWVTGLEADGAIVEMLTVTPAAGGTVAAQISLAERR